MKPTSRIKHELDKITALHESGKTEPAIAALRELVHEQPHSRSLRARLAEWLETAGRRDEAISELYKLQELLTARRDLLAAISTGLKILELDPKFDNPLSYIAKVNSDRLSAERRDQQPATDDDENAVELGADERLLSRIPLLSDLEEEELVEVALGMKRRLLHKGALMFSEGDTKPSLCFIVRGSFEIETRGKELDRAIAGQCLGEFAFLTGEPRSATVRALEESEVLELSSDSMESVVWRHPRIGDVLNKMYEGRVLARVLAESPLFESLDPGERHRIAGKFEPLAVEKGKTLFCEGDPDGALYLLKRGAVELRGHARPGATDGDELQLARLGPNEFFGEVSFLTGVPRTATAMVTENSELLRIDRENLDEIAAEHPKLAEVLKQFQAERVMERLATIKART